MGGLSQGSAEWKEGHLYFAGLLSLENNGGFAQIRLTGLQLDLSAATQVRLTVIGDGRTYEFRVATDARFLRSRIAYRIPFSTAAGEPIEVVLPLSQLEPRYRGRTLRGPVADLSDVRELAFLVADGREGAFSLAVKSIRFE